MIVLIFLIGVMLAAGAAWVVVVVRRHTARRAREAIDDTAARDLYGRYLCDVEALTQAYLLRASPDDEWLAGIKKRAAVAGRLRQPGSTACKQNGTASNARTVVADLLADTAKTEITETVPAAALSAEDFAVAESAAVYDWPMGRAQRHQHGRRRWLIAAAAAAVLASGGAGAFLASKAGHVPPSPSPSPVANSSTSSTASQLPGAAAMATLASYLSRSASVMPTVQAAIHGVEDCSESPAAGQEALQQAINTRQDILNGLRTLSVSGLPNGAQLVSTLTSAMRNSIQVDELYRSWMAESASLEMPCRPDLNRVAVANYVTGRHVIAEATAAKNAFVVIWNSMAPRYGQQTYSSTGF
jgi:hypothetical protein